MVCIDTSILIDILRALKLFLVLFAHRISLLSSVYG